MKKNILVVTGTRAEYGLLRSSMDAIREHPSLTLKLLVTGMHTLATYGKTETEIESDGYHIDARVQVPEGATMAEALACEIEGIGEYLARERPDCVLVLGDRYEPLAAATVASRLGIPIAHIHGGDVTGPGLDEENRRAITGMASIHFPATAQSAERLRSYGVRDSRIFSVGTPAADMIVDRDILDTASVAKSLSLDTKRPWLTFVMHPTSFEKTPLADQIATALAALEAFPDHEKIILYPNSDTGTEVFMTAIEKLSGARYHLFRSLPRAQYLALVKASEALVGNSSSGIIEAALLGTSAVDIGARQENRERGESVIHVDYDTDAIAAAITKAARLKLFRAAAPFSSPYGQPGAGKRIAEVLAKVLS